MYMISQVDIETTMTTRVYNEILIILSKMQNSKCSSDQYILLNQWTDVDILISLIRYLINNASRCVKESLKTWQFVSTIWR